MARPKTIVEAALARTALPPDVQEEIAGIRRDLDAQYRDNFISMTQSIAKQASALDRIQHTLELLIEHSAPELKGRIPGLMVAPDGADPDLATIPATMGADPIGAGYSLSQQGLAEALNCGSADISILLKHHPLKNESKFAVVVRKGRNYEVVNYHRRAVDELLRVIERPPGGSHKDMVTATERIKRRWRAKSA